MISETFNINCMNYMKKVPDDFFDLAFPDPNYNIGSSKPSKKPEYVKQKNGSLLKVKNTNKYESKEWDFHPIPDGYFDEIKRISKNQIIWGANYYNYPLPGGRIVWDKLNGDSDQFDGEIAYQSFNNRVEIIYYKWSGMIQGEIVSKNINLANKQQGNKKLNEFRIHVCQKPVCIYRYILEMYKDEYNIKNVFDSHMGSGSLRIACYELGLDFYGTELDKDHFNDEEKRFDEFKKQFHGEFYIPDEENLLFNIKEKT